MQTLSSPLSSALYTIYTKAAPREAVFEKRFGMFPIPTAPVPSRIRDSLWYPEATRHNRRSTSYQYR